MRSAGNGHTGAKHRFHFAGSLTGTDIIVPYFIGAEIMISKIWHDLLTLGYLVKDLATFAASSVLLSHKMSYSSSRGY